MSLGPVTRAQKRHGNFELTDTAKRARVISDDQIESHHLRQFSRVQVKKRLKQEFASCQRSIDRGADTTPWEEASVEGFRSGFKNFGNVGVAYTHGYKGFMEDRYLVTTLRLQVRERYYSIPLYGVFDGHGGEMCSQFLVKHLPEAMQKGFKTILAKKETEAPIYNFLRTIFVHLGREYRKTYSCAGSTAVIAVIALGKLLVANCGDSRVFLSTSKKPIALSDDAKPDVARFKEEVFMRGGTLYVSSHGTLRIQKGDVRGYNLTSSVGHDERRTPLNPCAEIVEFDLDKLLKDGHDRLVLLTDGVTDVGTTRTISDFTQRQAQAGLPCKEIAINTLHTAMAKGADDNCTAVVIDIFREKERAAAGA